MAVYMFMIFISVSLTWFLHRIYLERKIKNLALQIKVENYNLFEKSLLLLSLLVPVLVSGLRYNVGTDYYGTYTTDYYLILRGFRTRTELFNYYIYKFSQYISNDIQMYFMLTTIIFVVLCFSAIHKYSVSPAYSVILFFITYQYFTSMNVIRQYMAIAVVFWGLQYIFKRRYIKFTIVIFIAYLLHSSALIFIFLIPLERLKITPLKSASWCIGITAAFYILKPVLNKIIMMTGYSYYLTESYTKFGASALFTVMNIMIYVFALVFQPKNVDREYRLYVNMQMCAVIFCLIDGVVPLVGRLLYSYAFVRIFLIPKVSSTIKNIRIRYLINFMIILLFSIWFLYGALIKNWDTILPYRTIFSRYS